MSVRAEQCSCATAAVSVKRRRACASRRPKNACCCQRGDRSRDALRELSRDGLPHSRHAVADIGRPPGGVEQPRLQPCPACFDARCVTAGHWPAADRRSQLAAAAMCCAAAPWAACLSARVQTAHPPGCAGCSGTAPRALLTQFAPPTAAPGPCVAPAAGRGLSLAVEAKQNSRKRVRQVCVAAEP